MTRHALAVVSLLPPAKSGIADYTLEQCRHLARDWDLTVVLADDAPEPEPIPEFATTRLSAWKSDPGKDLPTPRLYHLGNNMQHAFMLAELESRPGIVLLHDPGLHHLMETMTVGRRDLAGYESHLVLALGERGRRLAGMRRHPVASRMLPYLLPLNEIVLDHARAIVVHAATTAAQIREVRPDLPVAHLPHFALPPPATEDRVSARRALGLAPDRLVVAAMGFATPAKQIGLTLRALAAARKRTPAFDFWIVGEAPDPDALMREACALGLADCVHLTGFVPPEQFQLFILAADLLVNLRYPYAGESSGSVARALGAGRCVVMFNYGAFAEVPDEAALKLPLDTTAAGPLADLLTHSLNDGPGRAAIEAAAMRHAAHALDPRVCADRLSDFLRALPSVAMPPPVVAVHDETAARKSAARLLAALPAGKARDYASIHERRLADTIAWLPQGSAGHAALELGTHHISMLPFLRDKGFAHVVGAQRGTDGGMSMRLWDGSTVEIHAFDAERPPFPFSDRCYDLVLCCEVLEHLTGDPMAMMTEINRVLKPGGMLLLTTPNIASARAVRSLLHGHWPYLDPAFNRNGSPDRHNLEYSPVELRGLMEAAGFEILRMETRDSWAPQAPEIVALLRREGHSTALRGDNIFLLAAKRTTYVRRFPAFLYGSGSNPGRLAETMKG